LSNAVKHLSIGDVLQLQYAPPNDNPERFAVKLIGYLPEQSLIITTPRKQGKPILVREGQAFTVRLLQGSNIFGFVARVLNASSRPYPHLHLAYPQDVESAVVRNAPRVTTRLQATVQRVHQQDQPLEHQALVMDLSSTGAKLVVPERLGATGEMVQLHLSLKVCGGEDQLQLLGNIRSIRESREAQGPQGYVHGIQFSAMNRFQQVLLCAFVLSEMAEE